MIFKLEVIIFIALKSFNNETYILFLFACFFSKFNGTK